MAASPATLLASYVDLTVSIITNDGRNVVVRSRLHVCAAFVTLSLSLRVHRCAAHPSVTLSASSAASVALSVSASTAGVRSLHRGARRAGAVRVPCGCRAGAVRVPCGSAALRHSFSSSLPPPPHPHHTLRTRTSSFLPFLTTNICTRRPTHHHHYHYAGPAEGVRSDDKPRAAGGARARL